MRWNAGMANQFAHHITWNAKHNTSQVAGTMVAWGESTCIQLKHMLPLCLLYNMSTCYAWRCWYVYPSSQLMWWANWYVVVLWCKKFTNKVTCPGSRESMVYSQTPMYIVSIKEQSPAIWCFCLHPGTFSKLKARLIPSTNKLIQNLINQC